MANMSSRVGDTFGSHIYAGFSGLVCTHARTHSLRATWAARGSRDGCLMLSFESRHFAALVRVLTGIVLGIIQCDLILN